MLLLRDLKALRPSKLNQACVNGQPHKLFRPARAPSPTSGSNEVTKSQCPLFAIASRFHGLLLAKGGPRPRRFM